MSLSAFFKDEIEKKKHFELVTQPCFINVCFWFIPLHLKNKDSICNYKEELSKVSINYPIIILLIILLIYLLQLRYILIVSNAYSIYFKFYKAKIDFPFFILILLCIYILFVFRSAIRKSCI